MKEGRKEGRKEGTQRRGGRLHRYAADNGSCRSRSFFRPTQLIIMIMRIGELAMTTTVRPKPLVPWMGGKSRLAKTITEMLPPHTCYCEVFCGAANVLFYKQRSKCEVINDINGDLVNLYRVTRHHHRELIMQLKWLLNSREDFNYSKTPAAGLTDIQRAARFLLVAKSCFGGRGGTSSFHYGYSATGCATLNRRIYGMLRDAHRRLDRVNVENDDFGVIINRYDRPATLFFCDPPYLETGSYANAFGLEEHRRLAAALAAIKGKFLLTINEDKDIRQLYKGCKIYSSKTTHSIANSNPVKVGELIITNYTPPRRRSLKN
jgi:DNA adenine methylase